MTAQSCLFLCLKDNFGVLVHDPESGKTAAIDAPRKDVVGSPHVQRRRGPARVLC